MEEGNVRLGPEIATKYDAEESYFSEILVRGKTMQVILNENTEKYMIYKDKYDRAQIRTTNVNFIKMVNNLVEILSKKLGKKIANPVYNDAIMLRFDKRCEFTYRGNTMYEDDIETKFEAKLKILIPSVFIRKGNNPANTLRIIVTECQITSLEEVEKPDQGALFVQEF